MTKQLDNLMKLDNTKIESIQVLSETEIWEWTAETLRYLGYGKSDAPIELDEVTQTTLNSVFKELQALNVPAPAWGIFDITCSEEDGRVLFSNRPEIIASHALWDHLKGYPYAAVLAVTLGSAFDNKLKRLMLESPSEAVVYDAAGSALVEIIANRAERHILEEAEDLAAESTFRFSPGYGDLDMCYNKLLLNLLRADKNCGITTTPGFAMAPKKSVVAILGFRPVQQKAESNEDKAATFSGCRPGKSCDLCLMNNDCSYKR